MGDSLSYFSLSWLAWYINSLVRPWKFFGTLGYKAFIAAALQLVRFLSSCHKVQDSIPAKGKGKDFFIQRR